MDNALDYLDWRGDLDFTVSPVNIVDIFLCSQLATPDYSGIVSEQPADIADVRDRYFALHEDKVHTLGLLQSSGVLPMLRRLPDTARFGNIRLCNFCNHIDLSCEEQFSAVTVLFPTGEICVSFRGTDDTIIGWKEDFNLAVMDSVPAQWDAREYLIDVAARFPDAPITVCGHSKGGNLAVFAAAAADSSIRQRITGVYSFDGPGFSDAFIASGEYGEMRNRITTVVSEHSIVGLLLNRAGSVYIVPSRTAGPVAHDGFNWEVKGTSFVRLPKLSEFSASFEKAMAETLSGMTREEKTAFINELFDALLSTGAVTCTDFVNLNRSVILSLLTDFDSTQKTRAFIRELVETYIKIYLSQNKELSSDRGMFGKEKRRIEKT